MPNQDYERVARDVHEAWLNLMPVNEATLPRLFSMNAEALTAAASAAEYAAKYAAKYAEGAAGRAAREAALDECAQIVDSTHGYNDAAAYQIRALKEPADGA